MPDREAMTRRPFEAASRYLSEIRDEIRQPHEFLRRVSWDLSISRDPDAQRIGQSLIRSLIQLDLVEEAVSRAAMQLMGIEGEKDDGKKRREPMG